MRTFRQMGMAAAIIGISICGAATVEAAAVTFQFTIAVDQIEDSDALLFGGPIQVGDRLHGYFTYDTEAMDYEPDADWMGYYEMTGGTASFGLVTPTNSFVSDDFFVNTVNDAFGHDTLTVQGYAPVNRPLFDVGYLDFNVIAPDTGWLTSDRPPANLSLPQMAGAGFQTWLSFQASESDERHFLTGHLVYDDPGTGDPPPAVPEPASLILLGSGLLGLVARQRRRDATSAR